MPRFLIDVNLPRYFSLWNNTDYLHQLEINESWTDTPIWQYAKEQDLTIISKDADFSNRIVLKNPPPKVIHIRYGNMKMRDFFLLTTQVWYQVLELNKTFKLVNVFNDRIEGVN